MTTDKKKPLSKRLQAGEFIIKRKDMRGVTRYVDTDYKALKREIRILEVALQDCATLAGLFRSLYGMQKARTNKEIKEVKEEADRFRDINYWLEGGGIE